MNAATGATSIEDNGVRATGFFIRRHFSTDESVVSGGLVSRARRHHIKNEGDEKKRDRDHEQSPSESVDLIGEGLLSTGTFQHFVRLELRRVLISGVRRRRIAASLSVEELGGRRRSVTDLTVRGSGGGRSLQLLGIL